jgi:hypothetical protein
VDPSYEVTVEELRRQVDRIEFRQLTKYQLARIARIVTQASMELVILVREPNEDIRLMKSHRVMMRLIAEISKEAK